MVHALGLKHLDPYHEPTALATRGRKWKEKLKTNYVLTVKHLNLQQI